MAVVSKGFTLLELLVTISIIGILLAVGSVSFTTAQKKGRDARRQGDMKAIQKSLEQYYALANAYPAAVASGGSITSGTNVLMNVVPYDPKNLAGSYVYTYTSVPSTLTGYCLCALLDNPGSGNASSAGVGGVCTYVTGVTATYYCVSNLQ